LTTRQYPTLPITRKPARPVSFVVVHFSDDYFHNILGSEAVQDPLNQLITIDNRQNLFFDNLAQAVNTGLERAVHELIAVVHEDVLLPPGWQQQLEASLVDLERIDKEWGLLGSAGWGLDGQFEGHCSDPHTYANTLTTRSFRGVARIDEQLMILRRSSGIRLDPDLPGIHYLGLDLPATLRRRGLNTYVVNAPTIHKFADETGARIVRKEDSPKIQARQFPPFLAGLACCDEYLYRKWPQWRSANAEDGDWSRFRPDVASRMSRPIVLLARGGSGSRLLSWLAQDAGVFVGTDTNVSGDAMEMVQAIYMGVLDTHHERPSWQRQRIVPRLRQAAASLLERAGPSHSPWGFKLPESMLLVPELREAFNEARWLHLVRDPLTTCLRRTHMTARFDNIIGRIAIRAAYRYCGRDLEKSLTDPPALRMAYTTIHQVETARNFARAHLDGSYQEIRFEDLLEKPAVMTEQAAAWLGTTLSGGRKLEREIDPERAARPSPEHRSAPDVEEAVFEVLGPLRQELGYL
jgi:Sulfotransferase family